MGGFFQRIFTFTTNLFSGSRKEKKEVSRLHEVPVEIARKPGLKCPECGTLISVSIEQIISAGSVFCTNCFLELKIDAGKSAASINALKKLKQGLSEAEKIKNQADSGLK